jgi:hypothetical protein
MTHVISYDDDFRQGNDEGHGLFHWEVVCRDGSEDM